MTYKAVSLLEAGYLRSILLPSVRARGNGLCIQTLATNNSTGSKYFHLAAPIEWKKVLMDIRYDYNYRQALWPDLQPTAFANGQRFWLPFLNQAPCICLFYKEKGPLKLCLFYKEKAPLKLYSTTTMMANWNRNCNISEIANRRAE